MRCKVVLEGSAIRRPFRIYQFYLSPTVLLLLISKIDWFSENFVNLSPTLTVRVDTFLKIQRNTGNRKTAREIQEIERLLRKNQQI